MVYKPRKRVPKVTKEVIEKEKRGKEPRYYVTTDISIVEKIQNKVNIVSISSPDEAGVKVFTFDCSPLEAGQLLKEV